MERPGEPQGPGWAPGTVERAAGPGKRVARAVESGPKVVVGMLKWELAMPPNVTGFYPRPQLCVQREAGTGAPAMDTLSTRFRRP